MEEELGLNDIMDEDDVEGEASDDLSDIEPVPNTATSRVEEPEFEETPIEEPLDNEEGAPEETPRRSGGRRLANLRNRETASKELPNGNKLAESIDYTPTETEEISRDIVRGERVVLQSDKPFYDDLDWNKCVIRYVDDEMGENSPEGEGEEFEVIVLDDNDKLKYRYANIHSIEGIDKFINDYNLKRVTKNEELQENKLQESINIDKFLLDVDDIEHETMSAIGTDEGVKNHYADGYKAGMDIIRLIADEDRQFPNDLVNDLEKKQSEIYTDYESLEDEEAQKRGIDDDYCEGWYQAFEDVLEKFGTGTITPDKKEENKLTEDIKDETAQAAKYIALEIQERGIMGFEEIDEMAADQLGITVDKLRDEQLDTDIYISLNYEGIDNNMSTGDFYTEEYAEEHPEVLEESKNIKTEKKIIIDNMGETYTIDTDAKTYTVKTDKGEKTFTFDEMNEFVRQGRGMNRIYKPMSVLAYTDFKNGNLNKWNVTNLNEGKNDHIEVKKKFILSYEDCMPVMYDPEDMDLEDALQDYIDNEVDDTNVTVDDIDIEYLDENKKLT